MSNTNQNSITNSADFVAQVEQLNNEAYQARVKAQIAEAKLAADTAIAAALKNVTWNSVPTSVTFKLHEEALPETLTALAENGWKRYGNDKFTFTNAATPQNQAERSKDAPVVIEADVVTLPTCSNFVATVEAQNTALYKEQLEAQLVEAATTAREAIETAKANTKWSSVPSSITFELKNVALAETIAAAEAAGWRLLHSKKSFSSTTSPVSQVEKSNNKSPLTPAAVTIPSCAEFVSAMESLNIAAYQSRLDNQLTMAVKAINEAIAADKKSVTWTNIPSSTSFKMDENPLLETIVALEAAGWKKSYNDNTFTGIPRPKKQATKTSEGNPLSAGDIAIPLCTDFVVQLEELNVGFYRERITTQLTEAVENLKKLIATEKEGIVWNKVPSSLTFEVTTEPLVETVKALEASGWRKQHNAKAFTGTHAPESQAARSRNGNPLTPEAIEIPTCSSFATELEELNTDAYQIHLDQQIAEIPALVSSAVVVARDSVTWHAVPIIEFALSSNPLLETTKLLETLGWINSNGRIFVNKERAVRQSDKSSKGNMLPVDDSRIPSCDTFVDELQQIFEQLQLCHTEIKSIIHAGNLWMLNDSLQQKVFAFETVLVNLRNGLGGSFVQLGNLPQPELLSVDELVEHARTFCGQLESLQQAILHYLDDKGEFHLEQTPLTATIAALQKAGWILKAGCTNTFINVALTSEKVSVQ